jgi:uncharacterized protein (DUF58 family)
MRLPLRPGRRLLAAIAAGAVVALATLVWRAPVPVWAIATLWVLIAGLVTVADYGLSRRAWEASAPVMRRGLPPAFAIGVQSAVRVALEFGGHDRWRCELYDRVDPSLQAAGLPLRIDAAGGTRFDTSYVVTPGRRGEVRFAPADLRIRSRWGTCELLLRIGDADVRRVYPDFAQIARYAWLAGDRRLQEIGIKTYQQRGEGTDFKQLSEYRVGDSVRHIDWRATLRMDKPIVRDFQDERDQCVFLLLDCGRRMRADDRDRRQGTSHFDQVLNATMLLSYVALKQGDAVGAMTFGTPAADGRSFAPRKGAHALNALMGELYSVQPTPTHSDYLSAAQDLLRRHGRRALVVVITNFRDEDSTELGHALRLLRSRHLVLLASVRERVVHELMRQPLRGDAALDVASAHLYEQARRDAFHRLSARDALMVDAEPDRLGVELVNRYHAVKRAGLM